MLSSQLDDHHPTVFLISTNKWTNFQSSTALYLLWFGYIFLVSFWIIIGLLYKNL